MAYMYMFLQQPESRRPALAENYVITLKYMWLHVESTCSSFLKKNVTPFGRSILFTEILNSF